MSCHNEFSNPTVSNASCTYANLYNYNMGSPGLRVPVPATTVSGSYIVPTWNYRPPYNTLIMGGSCTGYPSIINAYGKDSNNCNPTYIQRPCVPTMPVKPVPTGY